MKIKKQLFQSIVLAVLTLTLLGCSSFSEFAQSLVDPKDVLDDVYERFEKSEGQPGRYKRLIQELEGIDIERLRDQDKAFVAQLRVNAFINLKDYEQAVIYQNKKIDLKGKIDQSGVGYFYEYDNESRIEDQLNLSRLYLALERYRNAIVVLEAVLGGYDDMLVPATVHARLGMSYYLVDKNDLAIVQLNKAVAKAESRGEKPEEAWFRYQITLSLLKGDRPSAINAQEKLSELYGDNDYLNSIENCEQNTYLLPIVRVEPYHPVEAFEKGVEGYIVAEFTIDPNGGVENIDIIESVPSGVFDEASKKALLKWRYVNRCRKDINGMRTRLDFKID